LQFFATNLQTLQISVAQYFMKLTKKEKSMVYINIHPKEFCLCKESDLFSKLCTVLVDSTRKSSVDIHRKSKKHVKELKLIDAVKEKEQIFLKARDRNFEFLLLKAFLSSNTPLHRLNHSGFKEGFNYMKFPLPSEYFVRTSALKDLNMLQEKFLID
jgi:hypothetical protein